MADILYGKPVKEYYSRILKDRVGNFVVKTGRKPKLAIVQVGDRADSNLYISSKIKYGESIGFDVHCIKLKEETIYSELGFVIDNLNKDKLTDGIIIQLPLPSHIDRKIVECIDKNKDADGLGSFFDESITPATARGVFHLLDFYNIDVKDKNVTIVGRSRLVGIPISLLVLKNGGLLTVCNSETENIKEKTMIADILMVAIGKSMMIDQSYIKKDAIVIDIGINRDEKNNITGDVNYNDVLEKVSAITPVPMGVGQVTVLSLFENVMDLIEDFT